MLKSLIEKLQCPACHGDLNWRFMDATGERIETAEAACTGCGSVYPVREGIAVFLIPDLGREDLWEQVDSQLARWLKEHPEAERQLMESPMETLSPADQFYRMIVLEERGAFEQARAIQQAVEARLYTPEYLICHESQVHYLLDHLEGGSEPVFDLASGRCNLVQEIVRHMDCPLVATDFSLQVLRRDRLWLEYTGLYERVSLLALDARRTPFKDGAVQTLTTDLGLANIRQPGALLEELRRAVSGRFLAISSFYPPEDESNRQAIEQFGLSSFLFRLSTSRLFSQAGWKLQAQNVCQGQALPTPKGQILEGAGIDSLPVAETTLEWCTLVAS